MVKTLEINNLKNYSVILIMIHKVKGLIISALKNEIFKMLNKFHKDFIISVLWHTLSIKGRINFLQLSRFSSLCEQTYRNQFENEFDFYSFNKHLINQTVSAELVIAMDPSFIPKAGKETYGRGRYWSGVASATKWGLNITINVWNEWIYNSYPFKRRSPF